MIFFRRFLSLTGPKRPRPGECRRRGSLRSALLRPKDARRDVARAASLESSPRLLTLSFFRHTAGELEAGVDFRWINSSYEPLFERLRSLPS
jgi:hypothetical protein